MQAWSICNDINYGENECMKREEDEKSNQIRFFNSEPSQAKLLQSNIAKQIEITP
jgi:hypothetical protein